MTNAEKYLKDGVNVEEFIDQLHYFWWANEYDVKEGIRKFLNAKVHPILTEDERVILRNIGKECKTIFRNDGGLYFYTEDHKGIFPDLFQFIKERRRIFNRGVVR